MPLSDIVSVTIQAGTVQASRQGFGIPLFLCYHTLWGDNSRTYTSLAGLLADGATVDHVAYKMAAKAFSQSPRPPRIKIGRLPEPASQHVTELEVQGGASPSVTVRSPAGVTSLVEVVFDTDEDTTAATLATALDAIAGINAVAAGPVVTVTVVAFGPMFYFEGTSGLDVRDVTGDWGYDTQLSAIQVEDDAFYAVAIDVNSPTNVADVAAWVLANDRLAIFGPQYPTPADYDTAAGALVTGDNDNAASIVTKQGRGSFLDCAWLGECLPFDPGSQTWANKSLRGSETDGWTASQVTTLEAQNSNFYQTIAGISVTRHGKTHGGEFIDVTRGLHWLKARLQEAILTLLANARKVPMTDSGGEMIKAAMYGILQVAEDRGVLVPGESLVSVPRVADLPSADRAARFFSGIKFSGTLAGAVHKAQLIGNVSV